MCVIVPCYAKFLELSGASLCELRNKQFLCGLCQRIAASLSVSAVIKEYLFLDSIKWISLHTD